MEKETAPKIEMTSIQKELDRIADNGDVKDQRIIQKQTVVY